jgi:transposase
MAASCTAEAGLVERAKIIVMASEVVADTAIAKELGISLPTAGKWRRRHIETGTEGFFGLPRSGKPPAYDPVKTREAILSKLEEAPPKGHSQWDGKALANELNMSGDKVCRVLRAEGVCLKRRRSWCVGNDPNFAQKAADVVNLYANPPEGSIVLSLGEKPSIQALRRPAGHARAKSGAIVIGEKSARKRRGALNLFAALEIASGKVTAEFTELKRRVEFLEFTDKIAEEFPPDQEIHVVMGNCRIHKKCDEWLAAHPNFSFHYAPACSSWMNMAKIWFGNLSRKALRGASFKSAQELAEAVMDFIDVHNSNQKPCVWKKREVRGSQLRNTIKNLCN